MEAVAGNCDTARTPTAARRAHVVVSRTSIAVTFNNRLASTAERRRLNGLPPYEPLL